MEEVTRVLRAIISSPWCWYVAVPLLSGVVAGLARILSLPEPAQDPAVRRALAIGNELCVEAFGMNLGFVGMTGAIPPPRPTSVGSLVPPGAVRSFAIITMLIVLLLLINSCYLRFGRARPSVISGLSTLIGVIAIIMTFLVWRAT